MRVADGPRERILGEPTDARVPDLPVRGTLVLLEMTEALALISTNQVAQHQERAGIRPSSMKFPVPAAGRTDHAVIPGAPVKAEVMPFWRAVLGYEPRADSPDEDLVDPHRIGPPFWFEGMDEPRRDGGGAIHVAVWVPYGRR